MRLACDAGATVTEADIDAAEAGMQLWSHRVDFAAFRCELLTNANELERALDAALVVERLERGAGIEVLPAARAALLARLGRREEALAAVEDVIAPLERVHPAQRPYGHVADALADLGRSDEAAVHALQDLPAGVGRRTAVRVPLGSARRPRAARATRRRDPRAAGRRSRQRVRIPLEDEIRAYIVALEASGAGEQRGS